MNDFIGHAAFHPYPSMNINDRVIGTCSLCGGPVTVPAIWHGTVPPTPTCSSCGAISNQGHGPVIPMKPQPPLGPPYQTTWTDTSGIKTPSPQLPKFPVPKI